MRCGVGQADDCGESDVGARKLRCLLPMQLFSDEAVADNTNVPAPDLINGVLVMPVK